MIFLGLENIIKVYFYEDKVNNKKKNVKIKVVILLPYDPAIHSLVLT